MGEKIEEKGDCGKSIARIVPRFFSPAIGILCIFIYEQRGDAVYILLFIDHQTSIYTTVQHLVIDWHQTIDQ